MVQIKRVTTRKMILEGSTKWDHLLYNTKILYGRVIIGNHNDGWIWTADSDSHIFTLKFTEPTSFE
jgi:hypothetical protein